ncbi:MAG TPA: hypothetical protein VHD56_14350 [Tepidisphaeraceae bacterium]|nr:hypothetical protein [Tepidisphaeraceae bacterium]
MKACTLGWGVLVLAAGLSVGRICAAADADATKVDFSSFQDPSPEFRGTRWLTFRMENMGEETVRRMIDQAAGNGGAYGGWMATPDRGGGGFAGGFGGARGRRGGPESGPAQSGPTRHV